MSDIPCLLHIYGQAHEHDEVYIVGNVEALCALANTIITALVKRKAEIEPAWVNDGEGYRLRIICEDGGWDDPFWEQLATPYTGEYSQEARETNVIRAWDHWHKM